MSLDLKSARIAPCYLIILSALLLMATSAVSKASSLALQQTRTGYLLIDDFNDGVMDTSSNQLNLFPWRPLYEDGNLSFRETNGYFQVYGNTGISAVGQHRGIETNPYTYDNWEPASLETLELVSVVKMWNLDPETPAIDHASQPATARMVHHFCSNCFTSPGDWNSTVSVGYLTGTGTGPGWEPPNGVWGYRSKWNVWSDRYLIETDTLYGGESSGFFLTMVDNEGFDALDSTLSTGFVYANGQWDVLGSRKIDLHNCRKAELKSMAKWARNHDIDYRWDDYRLFPNGNRWPVRFDLVDGVAMPMTGDYVLEARLSPSGQTVARDTLSLSSTFEIFLDHTQMVIPSSLNFVLLENFTDSIGTVPVPASGIIGCYPDDAYTMMFDSLGKLPTSVNSEGRDGFSLALSPGYPSPSRGETSISYSVPSKSGGVVALRVYDAAGRLVRTLVEGRSGPGRHQARWDGRDAQGNAVASGIYFLRLSANQESWTRRHLVIR